MDDSEIEEGEVSRSLDSEIEEGEVSGFLNSNLFFDIDLALSYIDDKIEKLLGHHRKGFEGEMSFEKLGARFGSSGSFLPYYERYFHTMTNDRTTESVQVPSRDNQPMEESARNSTVPVRGACQSSQKHGLRCAPPMQPSVDTLIEVPNSNAEPVDHFDKKTLKDVGSDHALSTQENAKKSSNLGLDASAYPSAENIPSEAEVGGNLEDSSEECLDSPSDIIRIMTSFPIPGGVMLSPLHESLINLIEEKDASDRIRVSSVQDQEKTAFLAHEKAPEENKLMLGNISLGPVELKKGDSSDLSSKENACLKKEIDRELSKDKRKSDTSQGLIKENGDMSEGVSQCRGRTLHLSRQKSLPNLRDEIKTSPAQKPSCTDKRKSGIQSHFSSVSTKSTKNLKISTSVKPKEGNLASQGKGESKLLQNPGKVKLSSSDSTRDTKHGSDESRRHLSGASVDCKTNEYKLQASPKELALGNIPKDPACENKIRFLSLTKSDTKYSNDATLSCVPIPIHIPAPGFLKENWIGCDRCKKRRLLPYGTYTDELPNKWRCEMLYWLPGMNKCIISEAETTNVLKKLYQVHVIRNQIGQLSNPVATATAVTSVVNQDNLAFRSAEKEPVSKEVYNHSRLHHSTPRKRLSSVMMDGETHVDRKIMSQFPIETSELFKKETETNNTRYRESSLSGDVRSSREDHALVSVRKLNKKVDIRVRDNAGKKQRFTEQLSIESRARNKSQDLDAHDDHFLSGIPPQKSGAGSSSLIEAKGFNPASAPGHDSDDFAAASRQVGRSDGLQLVRLTNSSTNGQEERNIVASNQTAEDYGPQTTNSALKQEENVNHSADGDKISGPGFESTEIFFQAALKLLLGASRHNFSNHMNANRKEMSPAEMYGNAAKLSEYCASGFERCNSMGFAALAYKCAELAYLQVVNSNGLTASRDRNELQKIAAGRPYLFNYSAPKKLHIPKDSVEPVATGDIVIGAKNLPNFTRWLKFTQDVCLAMEASRKSRTAFAAARIALAQTGDIDSISAIKRVIDTGFHNVEELLQLIDNAMETIRRRCS